MKIQARATGDLPLKSVFVLYGKTWEDCEGSDHLSKEECSELIREWTKDDRLALRSEGYARHRPHEYRIVEDK